MTDPVVPTRTRRDDQRPHRHEVDVEPHAHPGDPPRVVVSDRESPEPHDPRPRAPDGDAAADPGRHP